MYPENIKNNSANEQALIGLLEWFRPGEHERVEKVLQDCKNLGIKHLRTGFSWADYYTEKGREWYDWLIPRLSEEVTVLPCFLYTPPSIGEVAKPSSPPKDIKAYADFLDIIITKFDQYFEWVELWNEPNNKVEYDYTLDHNWEKFAQMMIGAAYWMKQRGKKTILGGMSPIDPNWLENMIYQGVLNHFDAIGIHGFPEVFDQHWDGWEHNIETIRKVLKQNNLNPQIWITEAGFSTWQHDELKQLDEFRKVLAAPADRIYWYSAHDLDPELATVGGWHLDEREYHFGLKKIDGTPKLLYRMLESKGMENLFQMPYLANYSSKTSEKYSLICGGAGFIGTNLAKSLLLDGKKVMILDNISRPGVEKNLEWLHENYGSHLEVEITDIRNEHRISKLVKQAENVYHFAAQVAVTTSLYNPINDFEINARGTINILEAIRKCSTPPPLVFTSTNKVYGGLKDIQMLEEETRHAPADRWTLNNGISEHRPLDFHSPYGCSKGAADQYVIDYARTFNLPAMVFRMSCIYGQHQYGNEDQGWVAHFLIKALNNEKIRIYGDGKQVRDVLFVKDLVRAFRLATENINQLSGEAFNIGGGPENTLSLLELIQKIESLTGKKIDLEFQEARPGDQLYYVSDIKKFSQRTGWKPEFKVDKGVRELLYWICENNNIDIDLENIKKEASIDTIH